MFISQTASVFNQALSEVNVTVQPRLPGQYQIRCGCLLAGQTFKQLATSWIVNRPRNGKASISLGDRYELQLGESQSSITLCNKNNGEETNLWGGNNGEPEQQETITYQLEDGTKITIRNELRDDHSRITLNDITITQSERAIQITGLGNNQTSDLTINQSDIGGHLLDWAVMDGQKFEEQANGRGWKRPDKTQHGTKSAPFFTEQMGQLLGLFLLTGLMVETQKETGKPAETTVINTGAGDDKIEISQRDDGGLDITTNGETLQLEQQASQKLKIKSGSGNDEIIIDDSVTADVQIEAGVGDDKIEVKQSNDHVTRDEEKTQLVIKGGGGDDQIIVDETVTVDVQIDGGAGDDLLVGGAGDDKLIGGQGDDVVAGGDGNDLIEAGQGIDLINGGQGNDTLVLTNNIDPENMISNVITRAIRTESNQGVQAEDIEAVVYHTHLEQHPWSVELIENVIFLHQDGWAYQGLGIPLSDFNVDSSKQLESDKWTQWRIAEDGYELLDNTSGEWELLNGDVLPSSISVNHTISGDYNRLFSENDIMMNSITTNRLRLTLTEDLYFETSSSSLFTGGGGDTFLIGSSTQSKDGYSSTASGMAPDVYIISRNETVESGSDSIGTYLIDGFTIVFFHESGKISRELFFMRGDDVFIGDKMYYAS